MDKTPVARQTVKARKMEDHLPTDGPGREDMAKLLAMTFGDAWKAQEKWERKKQGRGPFHRWIGAHELVDLHDRHRDGDKAAITEAFFLCSINSLPLPRWVEMSYLESYREVRQYRAKSWDDVFGLPNPKGTHLETKKQEREFGLTIYNHIKQLKKDNPDIAIDGALFEKVGKKFAIGGKTKTETYYYKWKNFLEKSRVKTKV